MSYQKKVSIILAVFTLLSLAMLIMVCGATVSTIQYPWWF